MSYDESDDYDVYEIIDQAYRKADRLSRPIQPLLEIYQKYEEHDSNADRVADDREALEWLDDYWEYVKWNEHGNEVSVDEVGGFVGFARTVTDPDYVDATLEYLNYDDYDKIDDDTKDLIERLKKIASRYGVLRKMKKSQDIHSMIADIRKSNNSLVKNRVDLSIQKSPLMWPDMPGKTWIPDEIRCRNCTLHYHDYNEYKGYATYTGRTSDKCRVLVTLILPFDSEYGKRDGVDEVTPDTIVEDVCVYSAYYKVDFDNMTYAGEPTDYKSEMKFSEVADYVDSVLDEEREDHIRQRESFPRTWGGFDPGFNLYGDDTYEYALSLFDTKEEADRAMDELNEIRRQKGLPESPKRVR